jgi:hypothetical protein
VNLNDAEFRTRLSVLRATADPGDAGARARNDVLVRYHAAGHEYLHVRWPADVADEVFGRFSVRALEDEGLWKGVDPAKGGFRRYLKTVLNNMARDLLRQQGRNPAALPPTSVVAGKEVASPADPDGDELYYRVWRQELMRQAYNELRDEDARTGQPYHAVLTYRATHDRETSAAIAARSAELFGRAISTDNVRKISQRGREMLEELLLAEVVRFVSEPGGPAPTWDEVEHELILLELMDYCRKPLERRRAGAPE